MRERKLLPLSKVSEMSLIAYALRPGSDLRLARLRAHPQFARALGKAVEHYRRRFAAVYPGMTRTRRVSNAEWRKNGHSFVAEINEVMGLEGC
jgi:hypothetical protein